ncbi:MAG: exodeoxyribonuclease V subunit beta, partial [Desulfuromusa sp.]|nr:exodeoxyribonuclease V subunit beta [Desulfuromusa sp.]
MVKDFGSLAYDDNRVLASRESLAENLRLLYVALTRAKYRCYLVAGKIADTTKKNRPETSPISYLLHSSELTRTEADDLVGHLATEVSNLSATEIEEQLQVLEENGAGTIAVVPIPLPPQEASSGRSLKYDQSLACRTFSGKIKSNWRVASFTSLSAHDTKFSEQPDRDEEKNNTIAIQPLVASAQAEKGIFTFPKGAKTGIFWHELFEDLDFSDSSAENIDSLVAKGLEKYGHESAWQPFLSRMVKNVVETPLKTSFGSFSLADLKPGSWIPEMEFFFPLQFMTSDKLRDCLKQYNPAYQSIDLAKLGETLQFKPVRGAVRGFIDMVFEHDGRYYLLDWKSNHLGYRVEDYGELALSRAMEDNLYPLQYLLYTVALNQYLLLRVKDYDYETHFGGVFYLFLRGMDGAHG